MSGCRNPGNVADVRRLPVSARLPHPRQLAALGTVLCLYRAQCGGELSGWSQAAYAESRVGVCSDGPRESLLFFDHRGQCCWRICLLPDSDFLAWDCLLAMLPTREAVEPGTLPERLWRRLSAGLLGGAWRMCAVRLHALPHLPGRLMLAASPTTVSALGMAEARRIARAEGVEGEVMMPASDNATTGVSVPACGVSRHLKRMTVSQGRVVSSSVARFH